MATTTLKAKMIMKHDSYQNWEKNNPILAAGEWGVAIDSEAGICTVKVGDGVHHWKDLILELGQKTMTREYTSAYDSKGNEVMRWYNTAPFEKSIKAVQQAVSTMGISAEQASEAIRNIMQTINSNATLQEFANYIDNLQATPILPREEEPARTSFKALRSDLKTLTQDREYNLTEVHSDIIVYSDAEFNF